MNRLEGAKRFVVKIGSSLLTREGAGLNHAAIAEWAEQIAKLAAQGKQILVVSSGAIAEGMQRLKWKTRPHALYELQAAASVGQMGLVHAYESRFREHGLHTAQILLTHEDLTDRKRYLNARSTLRALLKLNVIPIINENDTVVTDEIRFGDNDTLAALVANLIEADALVILTDQPGLFSADPRQNRDAELVAEAEAGDPKLERIAGGAGALGRGGMLTKVWAARRAARSGTYTIIASGLERDVLLRLAKGEALGTRLLAEKAPLAARKKWLADQLQPRGSLVLDEGAIIALKEQGKSLLPIGVAEAKGDFERGELVSCVDSAGAEIARGLVNYNAQETRRILRRSSAEIETILGYVDEAELVHRDNLVIL
ncbi:MAG: glutamate 5-kinase [Burkholderiales bacterium]